MSLNFKNAWSCLKENLGNSEILMKRKSSHKIAELEKRLSAALKKRDQGLKEFLQEGPIHARRHAVCVAAIVLSGQPRIDEPLERAWARALRAYGVGNDHDDAVQKLDRIIVGTKKVSLVFTGIFAKAPVWLLQFTGMALDAGFLKFKLPDITKKIAWGSAGFNDARRWPLLPVGTIAAGDPIPDIGVRRVVIALLCIVAPPFSNVEDLIRPKEENLSRKDMDRFELFEMAIEEEMNPDRKWSSYEMSRVRKLCDRIF
jgi:hypothetical protein